MATQVLELAGDGFDLDDAVAADLDATPGATTPTPAAPPAAAPTAAAHTYDKGYKKWEEFDVDAAAAEVEVDDSFESATTYGGPRKGFAFKTGPRGTGYYKDRPPTLFAKATSKPVKKAPAPTVTKDGVDLTLPLFASVPENQRPAAARALSLNDAALAQLPKEQQKTIRDFKRCYEKQSADKKAGRVPGRIDAPEQTTEDIDWTLPILVKVPEDQKQSITMLLLMDESQMKTLPAESRETAQQFRKMYREEKDLKAQGPEAIMKAAAKNKKKKTPEEEAKDARDRVMKPLVDLHGEMQKMKGWQLRESRVAWDAIQATELAERRASERLDMEKRSESVREAMVGVDTSVNGGLENVAARLKKAEDKSLRKKERAKKKDRRDQHSTLRKMAQATSNLGI